ncbi:hypothetical protein TIFTF001_021297 [Ficus carica]|uniref:non-specific serine/threonine protein kinase n=1 Tax=Ficus carica TaxID=3494 RepID=A0AA88DDI6_FICCA|nr:hypothetical protein TIFTF001_021297 [Ficus carica]
MGFPNNIGKYQIGRTIGEGMFAKVKLAVDTTNGHYVAIKTIDKRMVQREIRTMKILNHPNIVRIHEVLGTKTKIYIVMEYVSGGQLSGKMLYAKRLSESEARKHFQQLIEAVDQCHSKGVYHRDLKPDNLLLDSKGNLKVSDFGLSALRKPGDLLSTTCGSPSYVAPELLVNKEYDGAAADIWSCGVILFELLAGYLPFDDNNLISLYRKITRAQYTCPQWFTESQKMLISRILEPNSKKRITIPEIIDDEWFQKDYIPSCGNERDEIIYLGDVNAAFDSIEEKVTENRITRSSSFINAFQLIAMSKDLDLSGLFEEEASYNWETGRCLFFDDTTKKTRLGSKHTFHETVKKIETAATDARLTVERINNFKMRMHIQQKMTRNPRSYFELSAEVIEVSPTNCAWKYQNLWGSKECTRKYDKKSTLIVPFCKSLSCLLTEKSDSPQKQETAEVSIGSKSTEEKECFPVTDSIKSKDYCGYSST